MRCFQRGVNFDPIHHNCSLKVPLLLAKLEKKNPWSIAKVWVKIFNSNRDSWILETSRNGWECRGMPNQGSKKVRTSAPAWLDAYQCINIYLFDYECYSLFILFIYVYIYIYICVCARVHLPLFLSRCMYIYIYDLYIYIYVYVCVYHVYIYIYLFIFIYTLYFA